MPVFRWLPAWARAQGPDPFLLRPLLLLLLVAGLLTGALLGGLAAWEHGQRLLLTHHARRALESRDWPNALNYLQDVLRVHPHDLEATRLMAAFCKEASPRSYFEWLQRLQHLEPDNRAVSLELAQIAFRAGQLDLAEGLARGLAGQPTMGGPAENLLALIAAARGQHAEALAHFQSARRADPDDPVHLANLGAFLASNPGPESDAAWPAVLEAFESRPGGDLAALRLRAAAASARGRREEALAHAAAARRHPAHALDDVLLELNLHHGFDPSRLPASLAAAQQEAPTRTGWRIALLEWTAQRRLWAEALAWIDALPADLRQSTHVRFTHLQCSLESTRPPAALADALEGEHWGEAQALRLAGLAEARRRAGDPSAGAWRARALAEAEASPLRAFALLDLVEDWPDWDAEEEILLQRLARVEVFMADALHALFRLHQRAGSAARLLPVAEAIHRLQPAPLLDAERALLAATQTALR